jgi:hypothetical protein
LASHSHNREPFHLLDIVKDLNLFVFGETLWNGVLIRTVQRIVQEPAIDHVEDGTELFVLQQTHPNTGLQVPFLNLVSLVGLKKDLLRKLVKDFTENRSISPAILVWQRIVRLTLSVVDGLEFDECVVTHASTRQIVAFLRILIGVAVIANGLSFAQVREFFAKLAVLNHG